MVRRLVDHGEPPRISSSKRLAVLGDEEDRTVHDGSSESDMESCAEHRPPEVGQTSAAGFGVSMEPRARVVFEKCEQRSDWCTIWQEESEFVPRGAPSCRGQFDSNGGHLSMSHLAAENWSRQKSENRWSFTEDRRSPAREGAALRGAMRRGFRSRRLGRTGWADRLSRTARQAITSLPVPRSSFLVKQRHSMPGARCWKQCSCWSR